jgi:hypothetical protein
MLLRNKSKIETKEKVASYELATYLNSVSEFIADLAY